MLHANKIRKNITILIEEKKIQLYIIISFSNDKKEPVVSKRMRAL